MAKEKVRADSIKYALSKRHADEFFLTEVKTGPSTMQKTLRLDALAIKKSWTQPCFTGYEIKVDRQDFLRDDKYLGYRNYCHRLNIACPDGLISPDEVPSYVGLIYYNPEKKTLYTKRKALYRDMEIKWEILYYIFISRVQNEKHPFFSSNREFIERYVEDKETKKELGWRFKSKLSQQVVEADKRAKDAEEKSKNYESKALERDEIVKILKDMGLINSWGYDKYLVEDIKKSIEKMQQAEYPQELCYALSDIDKAITKAKKIIWATKEG